MLGCFPRSLFSGAFLPTGFPSAIRERLHQVPALPAVHTSISGCSWHLGCVQGTFSCTAHYPRNSKKLLKLTSGSWSPGNRAEVFFQGSRLEGSLTAESGNREVKLLPVIAKCIFLSGQQILFLWQGEGIWTMSSGAVLGATSGSVLRGCSRACSGTMKCQSWPQARQAP